MINTAVACRFCEDAPCVDACPREGLIQSKEKGVILIEEDKCDGCGWCIEACPYGAIALHPDTQVAMVCDLCGGDPRCIDYCPEEALNLITEDDINQTWKQAIKEIFLNAKSLIRFIERGKNAEVFREADKKADRLTEKLRMLREKEEEIRSTPPQRKPSLLEYVERILQGNRIRYESKRKFVGREGTRVEADFMIPSHYHPKVLIQVKNTTSHSNQSSTVEDVLKIAQGKDGNTKFYLVTKDDGWFTKIDDLKIIIELQEKGEINGIYTRQNLSQLKEDLKKLLTVSDYGY
ncbi:MAG: 4Fe-4S dicluster domain-containing protein [Thermoproteota archaeon]